MSSVRNTLDKIELEAFRRSVEIGLDFDSSIRNGVIDKLPLGAIPIYDFDRTMIISTDAGAKVCTWDPSEEKVQRVSVTTFPLQKTYSVPLNKLSAKKFAALDEIRKDFAKYETSTILARMAAAEDLVQVEPERVKRMQKLLRDLGKKNVLVLPNGRVAEIDTNFVLVVRQDLNINSSTDSFKMALDLTLWEEVGFMWGMPDESKSKDA